MWILTVLAFLAFLSAKAIWRRLKYDLHKIPCPPGLPIFGNLLSLASNKKEGELTQFRGRWWTALGHPKLFKINILGRSIVYVRDSEVTKQLLTSTTPYLPKSVAAVKYVYMLIGNNPKVTPLFMSAELTPHAKGVRKIYAHWLRNDNIKHLFLKVSGVVAKMMKIVDERQSQGPIDFQKLSVKMAVDVIGIAAFDVGLGGLDNSRELCDLLIEGGHAIRDLGFNPVKAALYKWYPKSALVNKQVAAINRLTNEWDKLMSELLQRVDDQESSARIWHELKNRIDPETNQPLSYERLLAECATFVFNGTISTGHQIAWILALLASNPEATSKLLEQLRTLGIYGPESRDVCFEDFRSLTYLTAIIKEGMRIASVIPASLARILPEDMTILGHRIPKGTVIQAPSNRWMDSDEEWDDPLRFRPERWLENDVKAKYYLGFSYGPRQCPGQPLAMLTMRTALVQLIKTYDLSLTVPYEELSKNARLGVVVEAMDGIWLQATPRDSNVKSN